MLTSFTVCLSLFVIAITWCQALLYGLIGHRLRHAVTTPSNHEFPKYINFQFRSNGQSLKTVCSPLLLHYCNVFNSILHLLLLLLLKTDSRCPCVCLSVCPSMDHSLFSVRLFNISKLIRSVSAIR